MKHIAFYIRDIHFNKKSGLLKFTYGDIKKTLFFQNGNLIFAKTNEPEEKLGAVLFKLGKISKDTYTQIDQLIKQGMKLGETLVKGGYISEKDLYDGWIHQMKVITLNIFSYYEGEFIFEEMEGLVDKQFESKISVPLLIKDGLKQMRYDPSLKQFIEKKIPYPKGKLYFYLLSEEENKILALIDGKSSAEDILRSTDYNPELFWKSLYLFYSLDLIDIRDKEEEKREEIEERAEEKIEQVEESPEQAEEKVKQAEERAEQAERIPSAKEREKLAEVEVLNEKLPGLNYYQILNVSQSASEDDIKKAYFISARKYHPDSFERNLPQETMKKVEGLFAQITKAYQTLIDKEKRKDYASKIELPKAEEGDKDQAKRSNIKFRQAKTLYNQRRYEDALILLEEAIRLNRNKGSFYLLLALTESKIPSLHQKAEENFIKAVELEPWNPECYLGLGLFYKQEGLPARAKKQFKKALELDPDHNIARKELDIIPKGKKKRGLKELFSIDLFGQKKKKK